MKVRFLKWKKIKERSNKKMLLYLHKGRNPAKIIKKPTKTSNKITTITTITKITTITIFNKKELPKNNNKKLLNYLNCTIKRIKR